MRRLARARRARRRRPGGSSPRDRGEDQGGATIGYADGSSVTLEMGSPELDRLLQIAGEATAP